MFPGVTPENVASGVGDMPKEDATFRVWFEFGLEFARRATHAQQPNVLRLEISLTQPVALVVGKTVGSLRLGIALCNQCVTESTRPELHGHVDTNEDGTHCVCNQAVSLFSWSILAQRVSASGACGTI